MPIYLLNEVVINWGWLVVILFLCRHRYAYELIVRFLDRRAGGPRWLGLISGADEVGSRRGLNRIVSCCSYPHRSSIFVPAICT